MKMIAPRTGAEEITIAEDQLEHKPLVAAVYQYPADHPDYPGAVALLTRWQLTAEERARVAAGEDLYLLHLTFGRPLQPIAPQVGPDGFNLSPAT